MPVDGVARRSLVDRLGLVWVCSFYLTLAMCAALLLNNNPQRLAGWGGLALAVLLGATSLLFHTLFLPTFAVTRARWPMPYRRALVYGIGQSLVLVLLLHFDESFVGLGFALIGQVFGSLYPRQWPIPLLALCALVAEPLDIYAALLDGRWSVLLGATTVIGLWLFFAIIMYMLFAQRYRLMSLVGELRAATTALEASAAQGEELATLRERTRLAREMHDSLGHALVSINVKLEAAQRLYARDHARGDGELEATRALVRETMADLRRSLADLRAPVFEHADLPAALEQLAVAAQAGGRLLVAIHIERALPPLPPAVAEALWRVAREALTNVERHAGAAHAAVCLRWQDGLLGLRISDDGVGIRTADLSSPGHFGIVGMRERVEALGGSLRIARQAGGGTEVVAEIPYQKGYL